MTSDDEALGESRPVTAKEHIRFWNEWNQEWRLRDSPDDFMRRQIEAINVALASIPNGATSVLDVGCGTGWLGHELRSLGPVTGTDLSPAAIEVGRERFPDVDLRCGDFMTLELPRPFDVVVSSDALVPMPDHGACLARIAELQDSGGTFLLMTQNPFVWARRSTMRAHDSSVPNGRVEQWPNRKRVCALLRPYYRIERISTIVPGGDRGLLFWVENRYIRRGMGLLIGRDRWIRLLERMQLGRELVVVARRL